MFLFFSKKKEAPKVVYHKCGAALRSDDTYMLNRQKYCGKCYDNANPDKFVSFLRKTGATETETYSISSLMIKGLLCIR